MASGIAQVIRKITPAGVVTTFAGTGSAGFSNGTGTAASLDVPTGVAVDGNGILYVSELGNSCIRKITPAGEVTTFAGGSADGFADGTGTDALFNIPFGIGIRGNYLYLADTGNQRIRKISK